MAIDTAAKRKSCIGIGLGFLRTGVIPDGSNLEAPQRLHVQGLYSGIAASAVISIWNAVAAGNPEAWAVMTEGGQEGWNTVLSGNAETWTVITGG